MIEKITDPDPVTLQKLGQIWLAGNLQAHDFIPAEYWTSNLKAVLTQLPQATLYVARTQTTIQGFLGLQGAYIAGLFVAKAYQKKGIGQALLQTVQAEYPTLTLAVYTKNQIARQFYLRQGFRLKKRQLDPETGVSNDLMSWTKKP